MVFTNHDDLDLRVKEMRRFRSLSLIWQKLHSVYLLQHETYVDYLEDNVPEALLLFEDVRLDFPNLINTRFQVWGIIRD